MMKKCEFSPEMKYLYIKQGIAYAQTSSLSIALISSLREVYDHNTNQLYFYMSNLNRMKEIILTFGTIWFLLFT